MRLLTRNQLHDLKAAGAFSPPFSLPPPGLRSSDGEYLVGRRRFFGHYYLIDSPYDEDDITVYRWVDPAALKQILGEDFDV